MKESVASNFRTLVLTIALAMVAIAVGLVTPNRAYAQVPTQEAACGPWNQPLNVAIPARQRVSISRIVEIAAEDFTDVQAAQVLMPARLPFPRLATHDHTSSGVSTVEALVNAVYAGNSAVVKAALIRETTSLIRRLGPNRVSLEETWLWCPVVDASGAPVIDPLTGHQRRVSPTSTVCADGSIPRTGSRSRMLTSSFTGNFYAGSMVPWTNGQAPADYRGWRGQSLRVTIKAGPAFSIPRVYSAENHPRPGAQLCRRLPQLVSEAAAANSSTAKQAVLDEQAHLTTAAISEGDLPTAMWATMLAASAVNPAVANLAVARDCERRESDLQGRLDKANGRIHTLNGLLQAAIARGNSWYNVANASFILLILAIVLFVLFVRSKHKEMLKFTRRSEKSLAAAATEAKNQFWNGLEFELGQLLNSFKGVLPQGQSLVWAQSFEAVPSIARATADNPKEFFRGVSTAIAAALEAKPVAAPTGQPVQFKAAEGNPPRLPPPPATPIKFIAPDGEEWWVKGQGDFDRAAAAIDDAAFRRGAASIARVNPSLCATSPDAPRVVTIFGMVITSTEIAFSSGTILLQPALVYYDDRATLAHRVETITLGRVQREYAAAIRVGAKLRGDLDRAVVHIRGLEGQLVSLLSFLRKMVLAKRVPLNEHPEVERLLIHLGSKATSPDVKKGARRVTGAHHRASQAQGKFSDDQKVTRVHRRANKGKKTAPQTPSAIKAAEVVSDTPAMTDVSVAITLEVPASEAVTTESVAAIAPASRPAPPPRSSAAPHPAARSAPAAPPPSHAPTAPHPAASGLVEQQRTLAAATTRSTEVEVPGDPDPAALGDRKSPPPTFERSHLTPFASHAANAVLRATSPASGVVLVQQPQSSDPPDPEVTFEISTG